jgi:hypothetical protein
MPIRFAISKSTAQGESFAVDITQQNTVTGEIVHNSVAEMTAMVDEAFKLADVRLLEMNTRMLEAYGLEQYFTGPEWVKVVAILDILSGRQTADTVARRWQSEIEETAALEEGRGQAVLSQAQIAFNNDPLMQHTEAIASHYADGTPV